jgi:L-Ala-D/L-Glu epimerase / N-acetyl-D-glutamate racemase
VHVAALTVFHVRIPLRRVVRHASHARTATDNVLVRCQLADGSTGWGEGVPREYVTGETAQSAVVLLRGSNLAGQFEPCRDFESAVSLAERLRLSPVPGDERGIRGNAARCALELAVLDAFARHFREPLRAVARIAAPELYRPTDSVRYSAAITSSRGIKLRLLAWAYRLTGFRQIKVKVGIAGQDDSVRLRIIRKRVGARIQLRVDANEAWRPDDAVERIRSLQPYAIDCVEQPVSHSEIHALCDIRKQVSIPIMLDESLCGMVDAERAVRDGLCDRFNLRLSKCGGFIRTLRLVQFARKNGIAIQLGCQVGESAILSAAGRHFATSIADLTAVEGSYDRYLVREGLGDRDLTFGRGGLAPALPGPGLGVTVDPAALTRVVVGQEQLIG